MTQMTQRDVALWLAERLLGTPYRWGGDDPVAGLDCSGLVVEILKSVGLLPRDGDWSAAQLAEHFTRPGAPHPVYRPLSAIPAGALVFWGAPKITHVELAWRVLERGPTLTIGASGGGSATVDLAAAERQNAYVKVRPVRLGWVLAVDPF